MFWHETDHGCRRRGFAFDCLVIPSHPRPPQLFRMISVIEVNAIIRERILPAPIFMGGMLSLMFKGMGILFLVSRRRCATFHVIYLTPPTPLKSFLFGASACLVGHLLHDSVAVPLLDSLSRYAANSSSSIFFIQLTSRQITRARRSCSTWSKCAGSSTGSAGVSFSSR